MIVEVCTDELIVQSFSSLTFLIFRLYVLVVRPFWDCHLRILKQFSSPLESRKRLWMWRELNEPCTSPAAPLYLATSLGPSSWLGDQHFTLHTEVWAGVTIAPADHLRTWQFPTGIPGSFLGPIPHTLEETCAISLPSTRGGALEKVLWIRAKVLFTESYTY